MCVRFAAQLPPEFIRRLFATKGELPNLGRSWNVAPARADLTPSRPARWSGSLPSVNQASLSGVGARFVQICTLSCSVGSTSV
jgi:hypothetical protein